jgi:hypothetical protein
MRRAAKRQCKSNDAPAAGLNPDANSETPSPSVQLYQGYKKDKPPKTTAQNSLILEGFGGFWRLLELKNSECRSPTARPDSGRCRLNFKVAPRLATGCAAAEIGIMSPQVHRAASQDRQLIAHG